MRNETGVIDVDLGWAYRFLGYGPLVLVSTTGGMKGDVSTVAWCAPCSKSPPTLMISIGKSHKTYKNIMQTGYFGINVPTTSALDLVMYAGTVSGNDTDKLAERKIPVGYGKKLDKLPLMKDCVAWLECRLVPGHEAGHMGIIVGEVIAASCRQGVLADDHTWNVEQFPTLHHLGGRKFLVGDKHVVADAVKR